jgi:hypothetical protein
LGATLGNSVENKAFPQRSIGDGGVQFHLVTQVRHVIPNPNKERNQVTHVEADESASGARTPNRTGATNYEYTERAGNDGE